MSALPIETSSPIALFHDRFSAGEHLCLELPVRLERPVVVALGEGGVVVGYPTATLHAGDLVVLDPIVFTEGPEQVIDGAEGRDVVLASDGLLSPETLLRAARALERGLVRRLTVMLPVIDANAEILGDPAVDRVHTLLTVSRLTPGTELYAVCDPDDTAASLLAEFDPKRRAEHEPLWFDLVDEPPPRLRVREAPPDRARWPARLPVRRLRR